MLYVPPPPFTVARPLRLHCTIPNRCCAVAHFERMRCDTETWILRFRRDVRAWVRGACLLYLCEIEQQAAARSTVI